MSTTAQVTGNITKSVELLNRPGWSKPKMVKGVAFQELKHEALGPKVVKMSRFFPDIRASSMMAVCFDDVDGTKGKDSAMFRTDEFMEDIVFLGDAQNPNAIAQKMKAELSAAREPKKQADDEKKMPWTRAKSHPVEPAKGDVMFYMLYAKMMIGVDARDFTFINTPPREFKSAKEIPNFPSSVSIASEGKVDVAAGSVWAAASSGCAYLPKRKGITRAWTESFGMYVEEIQPGEPGCVLTQVMGFDMCGSIPTTLLDMFNSESVNQMNKAEVLVRDSEAELGRPLVPGDKVVVKTPAGKKK